MFYPKQPPEKTLENNRGRKLIEKDIEKYGGVVAAREEWMYEKFQSPQKRSVPDRLCGKQGIAFFIEFKAPGKRPTENQKKDHVKRRAAGFLVFVVDCYEEMDIVVEIVADAMDFGADTVQDVIPYYLLT